MKKWMLWTIAFAPLPAGPLFAQDITGTWQGTVVIPGAPREIRTAIKISKADGGLKAVLYNVDQAAPGLPIGTVTLQGSIVKMSAPQVGGSYEGKLDSDAISMTGTWTLGSLSVPLNLKHVNPDQAWAITEPPPPPKRMAADANPVFEVATIKPSRPDEPGKVMRVTGRQFSTINTTLDDLITYAYDLHARQIIGGPAWFESDKYDLAGEPDVDGQPSNKQLKMMIQKLLADRFQLAFHRDKKELSVYAITVGKTGSKLTKSEGDPNGLPTLLFRGLGQLMVRSANIGDFANLMQSAVMDRPVVDQTGLAGKFDFTLNWTPDEFQFPSLKGAFPPQAAPPSDAAPDLYTAIQQQLGLKLESTKAPAEVLVIDKVEKPSAN